MGLTERVRILSAAARGQSMPRYLLAERVALQIHPEAILNDFEKDWLRDTDFRQTYERFEGHRTRRMDRAWNAMQYARHTADLPGDTAECGVFMGLTSYLICQETVGRNKTHHAFDSFEGVSQPGVFDGDYWRQGDLAAHEEEVRRSLSEFDSVAYHKGWIPTRFSTVADRTFAMVHVDVDLYQPTRDSLEFFWPRLVPGGIILMDDYGYATCPGARKAADDLAAQAGVHILELSSGQGVLQSR